MRKIKNSKMKRVSQWSYNHCTTDGAVIAWLGISEKKLQKHHSLSIVPINASKPIFPSSFSSPYLLQESSERTERGEEEKREHLSMEEGLSATFLFRFYCSIFELLVRCQSSTLQLINLCWPCRGNNARASNALPLLWNASEPNNLILSPTDFINWMFICQEYSEGQSLALVIYEFSR